MELALTVLLWGVVGVGGLAVLASVAVFIAGLVIAVRDNK